MTSRWVAAASCLALSSCGPSYYQRSDGSFGSQLELDRVTAACQAGSRLVPSSRPLPGAYSQDYTVTAPGLIEAHPAPYAGLIDAAARLQTIGAQISYYEDCMRANGWVPVD